MTRMRENEFHLSTSGRGSYCPLTHTSLSHDALCRAATRVRPGDDREHHGQAGAHKLETASRT